MTVLEVLRGMRSKIEQGWTQHSSARDATGAPCLPLALTAACWCLYGAAAAAGAAFTERLTAYILLRRFTGGVRLQELNDLPNTTKEAMIELLDQGIAAAEAEAA